MTKVIGMLVALAMFCAMPAVAFAGGTSDSGNTNDNVQSGDVGNGGDGGDGGDNSGGLINAPVASPTGDGGDGGDGGDRNCSVAAGDDASCNTGDNNTFVDNDGDGVDDRSGSGGGGGEGGDGDDGDSSGGGNVTSSGGSGGGIGGGSESVTLAQTGFDAWVLALLGGLSLAGGLGLLAAQRRGRLNA